MWNVSESPTPASVSGSAASTTNLGGGGTGGGACAAAACQNGRDNSIPEPERPALPDRAPVPAGTGRLAKEFSMSRVAEGPFSKGIGPETGRLNSSAAFGAATCFKLELLSEAEARPSEATPSEARPSGATPSEATPSRRLKLLSDAPPSKMGRRASGARTPRLSVT